MRPGDSVKKRGLVEKGEDWVYNLEIQLRHIHYHCLAGDERGVPDLSLRLVYG